MLNADPSTRGKEPGPSELYNFGDEALETVMKHWVERGIWNNKWNNRALGRWKHEEPLDLGSESDPDTEAGRQREASRPCHQFSYQILKERKRIQEESENREGVNPADINARAYENIKNTWTKRGIGMKVGVNYLGCRRSMKSLLVLRTERCP